jgi:hypothetical protein
MEGHRLGDLVSVSGAVQHHHLTPFCTQVVEAPVGDATNPVVDRRMIMSSSELSDALEAGGGISVSGWGASVTASGSFLQSSTRASTHLYVSLWASVEQSSEQATYVDPPCLSHGAVNVLKQGEKKFKETYGTYFISGFKRQAWFAGLIDVQTTTEEAKRTTAGTLKASYSGWGVHGEGDASFTKELSNVSKGTNIVVKARASGWGKSYLKDFPTTAEQVCGVITSGVCKKQ